MSETIVLDAAGIAVNRTALDVTTYVAASGAGVNWGDAAIQAYMAEQAVGSSPVDYRLPNRQITIPLNLRAVGAVTFATIRANLQAKAGLFQREGGWIMRQVGATPLYADVVSATLHLGGSWLQAYRDLDIDAVLSLECLPDWYGDEIVLANHAETVLPHLTFAEASVLGNYPGRVRVVATENQGVDQHGLLWGFRCRNYNAGTTAALFYEAEQLVPVNGAAGTALAGASGGTAVVITNPPAGSWASMLSLSMVSGTTPLTHTGSYRVWARCYSGSATPQFQLLYGAGSLSVPKTNDPVQLPRSGAFYLLDLGEARLDAPPVGPAQWFGVIQAQATAASQTAAIDCVYLQPLDEGAGKLTYSNVPAASSITVTRSPTVGANDAATGTVAWTNPGNVLALDSVLATVTLTSGQVAEWLKATGYGFAVPSSTILGIQAKVWWNVVSGAGGGNSNAHLVKAGVVQAGSGAVTTGTGDASHILTTIGSSTDLWGGAWTATDINNAGFGVAFSFTETSGTQTLSVDYISLTVWYALATGFTIAPDAVIAASKTIELRTDGMFRQGGAGTIYAPVSQVVGDLPRIPPSGLEARPVQVSLWASRGEFDQEADAGIDDLSAKITYRPSYLYTSP